MEIVFRFAGLASPHEPGEGELVVQPGRAGCEGRRDLSILALEAGPGAFKRGPGTVRRIVVQRDPTLDDLLAATLLTECLEGRELPLGIGPFANYSALAREGMHPGSVALEESLEGIFLAIRNAHAQDLSVAENAGVFLASWRRMAEVIFSAARSGQDPFHAPLFGGETFSRERAFLSGDREAYSQDVLRGERWRVRIEGGPNEASGLLLVHPRSLLFKNWSRRDRDAPAGGTYLLLVVLQDSGRWVFSTDPVQRLPIRGLAEALQREEDRKAGEGERRVWFDGAPFQHTLVASPGEGTRLSEEEVLKTVRRWAGARKAGTSHPRAMRIGLLAAAVLVLALVIAASLKVLLAPSVPEALRRQTAYLKAPEAGPAADFTARGATLLPKQVEAIKAEPRKCKDYAIIVGVGKSSYGPPLPAACADAAAVYALLRDRFQFDAADMRLLVDEPDKAVGGDRRPLPVFGAPDLRNLSRAIDEIAERSNRAAPGCVSDFVFYFAGHGDRLEGSRGKTARTIGYLVLSGYWENRALPAIERGFDMGYLSKYVSDRIGASHQLLLVDCCFSGLACVPRGQLAPDGRIFEMWKKRAHVIVTASTYAQPAYEAEGGRSLFAQALLDGLEPGASGGMPADLNGDGIVTDEELGSFIRDSVNARNPQQMPQHFRGVDGDDVGQVLFYPDGGS